MNLSKISVITAVYNGEKHIEETILSIINQDYPNLEYIVIDGGSTDRTISIIKKYIDRISFFISEKDNGIADAFNKGIKLASGDYINFQGDGDGFVSCDALSRIFANHDPEDLLISARINRTDENGEVLYSSRNMPVFKRRSLLFRMSMPHQGLFTHKSLFENYGLFDEKSIFAMDYEHLLRAYKNFPKVRTCDCIVANWRDDGLGNGRTIDVLKEYYRIKKKNKVAPVIFLFAIYVWDRFKFFIKSGWRK